MNKAAKLLFAMGFACISFIAHSQFFTLYSEIGYRGSLGGAFIKNENIRNDMNILEQNRSSYRNHGFNASISYLGVRPINTVFGVYVDFMNSYFNKSFNSISTSQQIYNKTIDYKYKNVVTTFRYTNFNIHCYLEAGIQISTIKSVKENNSIENPLFYSSDPNYVLTDHYPVYKNLVIGTGFQSRYFSLGFRITSNMENFMAEGYNQVCDGYYNDNGINTKYYMNYLPGVETSIFTYEFNLALKIPVFSIGKASCGNTSFSIFRGVDYDYYW